MDRRPGPFLFCLFHSPCSSRVTPPETLELIESLTGVQNWGQQLPLDLAGYRQMSHQAASALKKTDEHWRMTPRLGLLAQVAMTQTLAGEQPSEMPLGWSLLPQGFSRGSPGAWPAAAIATCIKSIANQDLQPKRA